MKGKYPLVLFYLKKIDSTAVEEFKFHPVRRWRFDFCLPMYKIAIEINGGIFSGGRHSRGAGQLNDFEKLNEAQLLGWRVFQFTPQQVLKPVFIDVLKRAID